MLEFECQHCGALLRMDDAFAGRDGWCRECKRMVVVPSDGVPRRVEDLPPGQAIARLQQLLSYAARKADEYKQFKLKEPGNEAVRENLERVAREARKALAAQQKRAAGLESELERLSQALAEAEARARELEAAEQVERARDESGAEARVATLEAALEAERAARMELEEMVRSKATALQDVEKAREEERAAKERALAQLEKIEAELKTTQELLLDSTQELARAVEAATGHEDALNAVRSAAMADGERLSELEAQHALDHDRIAVLDAERDTLQCELASAREEIEWLLSGAEALEVGMAESTSECARLRDDLELARGELDFFESELKTARERLAQAEEARERLEQLQRTGVAMGSEKGPENAAGQENTPIEASTAGNGKASGNARGGDREEDTAPQGASMAGVTVGTHGNGPDSAGTSDAELIHEVSSSKGGALKRPVAEHAVVDVIAPKRTRPIAKSSFVERWHREAEAEGALQAQFRLGVRYEKGVGVERDDAEALRWLTRAATGGHPGAQCQLGRMYAEGRGAACDLGAALTWYRRAAEQQDAGAQCELGLMYLKGAGLAQDEDAGVAWLRRAAEQGELRALHQLGQMHAEATGPLADPAEALRCFERAAGHGHAEAQFHLGKFLLDGLGVPQDECRAVKCLQQAAEQGHVAAQRALGTCLQEGRGTVQNYVRAYAWYTLASVRFDEARAARDNLATALTPDQQLEGQRLAEEFHRAFAKDDAKPLV